MAFFEKSKAVELKADQPGFIHNMKKDIKRTRWVKKDALAKLMYLVIIFVLLFGFFFLAVDGSIAKFLQWLGVKA